MKTSLSFILFFVLAVSMVSAQNFNNTYVLGDEPPAYGSSEQSSVITDATGAIVTVHNVKEGRPSFMPDAHNAHVLKVDDTGAIIWSKEYGGSGYDDRINAICEMDDGGYLLVGSRGKIRGAHRNWVLRLDVNGNKLWDRLYYDNYNAEMLVVARTSETAETYFIAGMRSAVASLTSEGYITAMKVDDLGQPFWMNQYTYPDFISNNNLDYVTSMVEDGRNNGFVLAGLRTGARVFGEVGFGGKLRNSSLFTLGIRLDGTVFSSYNSYDVGTSSFFNNNVETEPHINRGLDGRDFVMGFGVRGGKFDGSFENEIAFMPLNANLDASFAFLYAPKSGRDARAHSIYSDVNGFYGLGCTGSRAEDGVLYSNDEDRVSFLRITPDGEPDAYITYEVATNAGSTFMVEDANRNGYVLKSDQSVNGNAGMGLIHLLLDGRAACGEQKEVRVERANVRLERERYVPYELNLTFSRFPSIEGITEVAILDCYRFIPPTRREGEANLNSATDQFVVYPSLIGNEWNEVSLEFSLATDEEVEIAIVNAQGQLLKTYEFAGLKGSNIFQINARALAPGVNTIILHKANKKNALARVMKI